MPRTTDITTLEPAAQENRDTLTEPGGNHKRQPDTDLRPLSSNQGRAIGATRQRERTMPAEKFRERYGPWALVTGGSAGIGAEFARQLAGKRLNLILVARRAERLQTLAGELARSHGVEVRTVAADLSDRGSLDAIRQAADDVDVGLLVNNAGSAVGGRLLDTDLEQQRRSVELNVLAPLALTHELGLRMRACGKGGIIFLSSPMALQGVPHWANFAATKSYDLTLADGLAYELEPQGIDVLSVLPGPTLTEGAVDMGAQPGKGLITFGPPETVVAETLAALGKRSIVIPGRMNRLMSAVMSKCLSRSTRTKLWAKMLAAMGMAGDATPSPRRSPGKRGGGSVPPPIRA